jgi:PAS domain S-box-containing protein
VEELIEELWRTGRWEGELTVCRKDGSTFPAHMRDRVMADRDGKPAGMIGVAVDVSARVASERALVEARNYMRAVAESMGEPLFTLDTEGRLTYMNAAGETLLGWTRHELHGRVMHDVTHHRRPDGSSLPIAECPILHARRDRVTIRVEDDVFVRRDGRVVPVEYTAAPFETADGVQGSVVVFNDISERKAQEETLRREVSKLSWIGRIHDALAQDRFVLYGQPIMDLRTQEVVQLELLLRLREPDGQIIGPASFLQIAEQYGLIGDIDRWVIRRAAEMAATGRPVELNISGHSIGDGATLEHIERCLEQTGADPTLLVFELTETAIVEDQAAAHAFAERLQVLGCKLALDDFGTGYGGFTYLKQLPLDFLKIDIEFVRDLATNAASRHVVQAVVALARGFRLQTVAEGVEDGATLELLRELGVDFAQGYHIARPAPLDTEHRPEERP